MSEIDDHGESEAFYILEGEFEKIGKAAHPLEESSAQWANGTWLDASSHDRAHQLPD